MTKYIIIEKKDYQYSTPKVTIVDSECYDKETAEAVLKVCQLKNKNLNVDFYMVELKPEQLTLFKVA
jgi:hypothetical protein